MTVTVSGLESLVAHPPSEAVSARLGLLTNPTGIDRTFRSSVDLLAEDPRFTLRALFGPEHGVRGDAQAGAHIETAVDARTGLQTFSLYGASRAPSPEMLAEIDMMVIDLQDIGVRFTTYISSVAYVIDACADAGVRVLILDRPNPLGGASVRGNMLDPAFRSFVGVHAIPTIHGLTIAEFALLYARQSGKPAPLVVPMQGWDAAGRYNQTGLPWVMPSPNLPSLTSLVAYQATCLIEGTNLSEGRGTTSPFESIGAPWLDPYALIGDLTNRSLDGVTFRPTWFTPTFSKHSGQHCAGVFLHVTDHHRFDPIRVGGHLLDAVRAVSGEHFSWISPNDGRWFIDLLAGTSDLRTVIDNDLSLESLFQAWEGQSAEFRQTRSDILLYERS